MNRLQNYKDENIAYWTKRAPGYSDVNRAELCTAQRKVWSQALDARIQLHFEGRRRKDIHVLDVGTGPGFFAILLAELGYRVTAVDYTGAMLEQARRNAGRLAEKITFQQMNAEELSFPDGSFDGIVSRNLTWNLSDRENVRAAGAADDTAGTDVAAMEAIARQAPLSRHLRPQWDQDILGRLGMRVSADTEVWKQVWTRDEWINNASTPMFLIAASKPA